MKKKIGICLLIILVIIGLICGIRGIRNFWIIQNIFNQLEENLEKDNYYLRTTTNYNNTSTLTKIYYKEGIGKMVAENGIYTWVDGEKAYMVDEENKTIYNLDIENSIGLVSSEMFASFVPGYSKNAIERFIMAASLQNKIKSDKIDDKKCYMIQINEEGYTKTYWIEKVSKKPLKAKIEFEDGQVYEYDYQLQFNVTKLKDVELPDITDYTIIEAQAND